MNSKTKYYKKNQTGFNREDIEFLLSGGGGSCWRYMPGGLRDAERGWRRLEPKVMPIWIRHRPGSRPWGWWRFSLPIREPRLLADGTKQITPSWMKFSFGLPTASRFVNGQRIDHDYESESDYLYRHEKLTDYELTLDSEQLRANTIAEPDAEAIQAVLAELVK